MNNTFSKEEVQKQVAQYSNWRHRFEIRDEVIPPGNNHGELLEKRLEKAQLPTKCQGLRILDIGASDGHLAFRMEKAGGDVTVIDRRRPQATGFPIAKKLLKSKLIYQRRNAYDLSQDVDGKFDIVLCLGVLYHLRNPLLALDRIRDVISDSGTLFIESALLHNDPNPDVPLAQLNLERKPHKDTSVVWLPNFFGLQEMIKKAQFEIEYAKQYQTRAIIRARARRDNVQERQVEIDYAGE